MIAIFGAGAIGCWVGGRLAAAGASVTLIGRARVMDELAHGLRLTDLSGSDLRVELGDTLRVATDPEAARDAAIVIVTVKSAATADAGRALAPVLARDAIVISLQNGVRNPAALREVMPDHRVLAGMVEFNVVRRAAGEYHRGTIGKLMIEADPGLEPLIAAWRNAHLTIQARHDMPAVQWGKLVMNLNNAINALCGLPLASELAIRDFRRCLAAAQFEALDLIAAAKLPVARITVIPPRWMPRLLRLPDWLFRRIAARAVAIDPHARSSMWDDVEAGRATEIDYMQGEVVALADRLGRTAPINRALVDLVHAAERGGRRDFTGPELLAAVTPPTT